MTATPLTPAHLRAIYAEHEAAHNRGEHDVRESQFAEWCPTCAYAVGTPLLDPDLPGGPHHPNIRADGGRRCDTPVDPEAKWRCNLLEEEHYL